MRPAERIKPVESDSGVHQSGGMAQLQANRAVSELAVRLSAKSRHQMKPGAILVSKLTCCGWLNAQELGVILFHRFNVHSTQFVATLNL